MAARRGVRSGLRAARHRRHVPRLPDALRARDPAAPASRSPARAPVAARAAGACAHRSVCALLAAAIFVPYVLARRDLDLARGIGDVGYYGATLASYLAVEHRTTWRGERCSAGWRGPRTNSSPAWSRPCSPSSASARCGRAGAWRSPASAVSRCGGSRRERPLVVSERQRLVLAVSLFLCCAGFVLGDLTTLTTAQTIEPGLVPARVLGYLPAALLALGGGAAWLALCGAGAATGRWCRRALVDALGARPAPGRALSSLCSRCRFCSRRSNESCPASTGCAFPPASIRWCRSRWSSSPRAASIGSCARAEGRRRTC